MYPDDGEGSGAAAPGEGGGTGPAAPAGGGTPSPQPPADPGGAPAGRTAPGAESQDPAGSRDGWMPRDRAEEMAARRVEKEITRVRNEERQRFRKFLEDNRANFDPAAISKVIGERLLKGLGVEPEGGEPKLVTAADLEKALGDYRRGFDERLQEIHHQQELREDITTAKASMERAKVKHADAFAMYPDLEADCARIWGSPEAYKEGWTVEQIVDKKVASFQAALDKAQKAYIEGKKGAPRVLAPGASPGGPRGGSKEPEFSTDEEVDAAADKYVDQLFQSG